MYLLLVFVVVLVIFSAVQNSRRRKNTASMQQAIEPGVRVMTTSGIYGIVQEVEPDSIIVEISEGVDVRFAKAAVMKVVPDLVDLDGETDAADHDSEALDDDDLHAELDALGAGTTADPHAEPVERTGDNDTPADPKPATPVRRDGHEPGTGSVPTT